MATKGESYNQLSPPKGPHEILSFAVLFIFICKNNPETKEESSNDYKTKEKKQGKSLHKLWLELRHTLYETPDIT